MRCPEGAYNWAMNRIFTDILDGISTSLRSMMNGNYEALAVVSVVVIVAVFVFLRK